MRREADVMSASNSLKKTKKNWSFSSLRVWNRGCLLAVNRGVERTRCGVASQPVCSSTLNTRPWQPE
ncbi:hypothetical protein VTK73DRAFT_1068 [Phialemonium thermophilum]|uniref:Uncharacterized protein n=1 Tax=Phialemonium thermophilum TaxID=223376 RepID=A0ABR3VTZ7_9PEZI